MNLAFLTLFLNLLFQPMQDILPFPNHFDHTNENLEGVAYLVNQKVFCDHKNMLLVYLVSEDKI